MTLQQKIERLKKLLENKSNKGIGPGMKQYFTIVNALPELLEALEEAIGLAKIVSAGLNRYGVPHREASYAEEFLKKHGIDGGGE